jgi:hypothetical protein
MTVCLGWEKRRIKDRYAMLRLLARFSLKPVQARRLFDPEVRGVPDQQVLENPYLIYELDRDASDPVGFATIDRGMFTRSAPARAALDYDPLTEPVEEANDDRRVRAGCVAVLIEAGPLEADGQWREAIDAAIDKEMPSRDDPEWEIEEAARAEKARALKTLARSRGRPCWTRRNGQDHDAQGPALRRRDRGQRAVARPTGKARVQLGDKVGAQARTLSQFPRRAKRWGWERGYYLNPDCMQTGGYRTVIVDEASMLTEEMLAALIDSLVPRPDRLILCGDHRQLPPIGVRSASATLRTVSPPT